MSRPFLPPCLPLLLLPGLGFSCAAPIKEDLVRRHVIAITDEGVAVDPVTRERHKDYRQYIQNILQNLDARNDEKKDLEKEADLCSCVSHKHPHPEEKKVRRLLIHIHGGLNDPGSSLQTAQRNSAAMIKEENLRDWHYPIFVTWPSGPISSYGEHLFVLRQGRHSQFWGALTSPVYFSRDLLSGLVNLPRSWLFQTGSDTALAAKVAFNWDILPSWRSAGQLYAGNLALSPPLFNVRLGEYERGAETQAGRLFLYWTTLPLKLLATAEVLDGMGDPSWEVMLHRAKNLFRRAKEFEERSQPLDQEEVKTSLLREESGAFAIFIRELLAHMEKKEIEEKSGALCYQITLVGHSMGALIINDLLHSYPDLPVTRIVYMAPACSILDAEQAVVPFLRKHPTCQFHILTLHPQAEVDEINFFDLVPRGSLLEWIDNWYTHPTSHMERRLGKWINLLQALHVFQEVKSRISVKAFGVQGDSLPQKHGQFNLCPFWRRDFWDPAGPLIYRERDDGRVEAEDMAAVKDH